MAEIELLIGGRLSRWCDGQMELPRQPPFPVLASVVLPWAAFVTIDLTPEMPDTIRLCDVWYQTKGKLHVVAGDGRGTWISAVMQCVEMTVHSGIQQTIMKPGPLKFRLDERSGLRVPYRDQPIYQPIAVDVNRYVLAAERYEFTGPPARADGAQIGAVLH